MFLGKKIEDDMESQNNDMKINDKRSIQQGGEYLFFKKVKTKEGFEGIPPNPTISTNDKDMAELQTLENELQNAMLEYSLADKVLMEETMSYINNNQQNTSSFKGKNIYINEPNAMGTAKYQGCYENTSSHGLIQQEMDHVTVNKCNQQAMKLGADVFAISNEGESSAQCYLGNELAPTAMPVLTWSTKISGSKGSKVTQKKDGNLIMYNSAGDTVWATQKRWTSCDPEFGGEINPDKVEATWGMNCAGNSQYKFSPSLTNITDAFKKLIGAGKPTVTWNWEGYKPYNTSQDPAYGCEKSVNVKYLCGNDFDWKTKNVPNAYGSAIQLDCAKKTKICDGMYLVMQTDGNLVVYSCPNASEDIQGGLSLGKDCNATWASDTWKNGVANENPEWIATKGHNGRCYLKAGESLSVGQWIGSVNGNCRAIMQADGNLAVYKWISWCDSGSNVKVYTPPNANRNNMGDVGYVNNEEVLKKYPDNMLSWGDNYTVYENTTSEGNNIGTVADAVSADSCKTACNKKDNCAGFIHHRSNNSCTLMDSSMFPVGKSSLTTISDIYARERKVNNANSCNKQTIGIGSNLWNKFKQGGDMDADTQCALAEMTSKPREKVTQARKRLKEITDKIYQKIEILSQTNTNLSNEMNSKKTDLDNKLQDFHDIEKKNGFSQTKYR